MTIIRFSLLLICSMGLSLSMKAQSFQLAKDSASTITVTGTSTLHGWTVAVNEIQDIPQELIISGDDKNTIDSFAFGVVVSSMDGGRGASMNAKITKALQATAHPIITYQQKESAIISDMDDAGNFKLLSKGL